MSDTPRTDAFIAECEAGKLSIWDALDEIREHARQLERELSAQSGRWVPVEPTLEMLLAGMSTHRKWENEDGNISGGYWKAIYRAMLAAAPPAPGKGGEG